MAGPGSGAERSGTKSRLTAISVGYRPTADELWLFTKVKVGILPKNVVFGRIRAHIVAGHTCVRPEPFQNETALAKETP